MSDTVPVDAMDSSKRNSPVAGPVEDEATVMLDSASQTCYWNDQQFNDGDTVVCDGKTYECSYGSWVSEE